MLRRKSSSLLPRKPTTATSSRPEKEIRIRVHRMAKVVTVNRSVDSTTRTTRVPPGNVTSVSSTTTPMCERVASARPSTRTLTTPTIGNARADSKTLPTGICASSAKRPILMVNPSPVAVKALAREVAVKALATMLEEEEARRSPRTGIVPVAESAISPNVAVVSSAPRRIPTDRSETIGSALSATSPTSPADIRASSARNRIPMEEAAMAVVGALVVATEEGADEVAEEAVVAEVVAEVVAVSEEDVEEAVATGVSEEVMIRRNRTRRSLLTSRAL